MQYYILKQRIEGITVFSEAWQLWRRAIGQGAVWSTIIWSLIFTLLLVVLLIAVGAGSFASALYHPSVSGSGLNSPLPYSLNPHVLIRGVIVIYILLLAAGPLLYAGIYGLMGQAAAGASVTWRSFWSYALSFYGRAWGAGFFLFLWAIALSLVGGILIALLHAAGIALVVIAALLSLPWVVRMLGGLFVDRLKWSAAFRAVFRGPHYGGILGGTLLGALAAFFVGGIAAQLIHSAVGFIIYMLVTLALGVAVPIWEFALYRAAANH